MTFGNLIAIHGVILAASVIACSLLIPRLKSGSFCLSFIVGYVVFMVVMAMWYFPAEKDAQAELFWVGPGVLTLPASFLIMFLPAFSKGDKLFYLIVLGVVQYGLIGFIVDLIVNRVKRVTANNIRISPEPWSVASKAAPNASPAEPSR